MPLFTKPTLDLNDFADADRESQVLASCPTYTKRASATGALTGAWFGLLIGLLVGLFTFGSTWLGLLFGGLLIGALQGAVFGYLAHRSANKPARPRVTAHPGTAAHRDALHRDARHRHTTEIRIREELRRTRQPAVQTAHVRR